MKKMFTIVLVLILLLSAVACTGDTRPVAEDALGEALTVFSGYDSKADLTAFGYTSEDVDEMFADETSSTMFEVLTSTFDFEIVSVEEDGDVATAVIEVTNVDMSVILEDYLDQVVEFSFSEGAADLTDEELEAKYFDILVRLIEADTTEKLTSEVTIELTYHEGEWVISDGTDAFFDAAFGGLADVG